MQNTNKEIKLAHLLKSIPGFIVLMLCWSFATPIFEGPDEILHWQFAQFLHKNKTLPVYQPGFGEANSPPLYYFLISPVASETETPPFYIGKDGIGAVRSQDGIIHPRAYQVFQNKNSDFKKYWPIRIARIITILISIITILGCFLAGKEATGKASTGIITASFAALLPQFTFRCSHISNDSLVTALSGLTVFLLIIIHKRGFSWKHSIFLVCSISLAFLTKISAIIFIVPFIWVNFAYKESTAIKLKRILILTLLGLTIVSPWLIRNKFLYDDILAISQAEKAVPTIIRHKEITSEYFYTQFPALTYRSFIGTFGWMNINLPEWFYKAYLIIFIFALLGLLFNFRKSYADSLLLGILSSIIVLAFLLLIKINLMFNQPQGRYLFPALPAFALLIAVGFESLPFWRVSLTRIFISILFLLNIYALVFVQIPYYW